MHEEFTFNPKVRADVRSLLAGLLPVSARVNGSSFDIYVSTPEMLNSSENKDDPFGNIKTDALVINAVDDPLALHENAIALLDQITTPAWFPYRMEAFTLRTERRS